MNCFCCTLYSRNNYCIPCTYRENVLHRLECMERDIECKRSSGEHSKICLCNAHMLINRKERICFFERYQTPCTNGPWISPRKETDHFFLISKRHKIKKCKSYRHFLCTLPQNRWIRDSPKITKSFEDGKTRKVKQMLIALSRFLLALKSFKRPNVFPKGKSYSFKTKLFSFSSLRSSQTSSSVCLKFLMQSL